MTGPDGQDRTGNGTWHLFSRFSFALDWPVDGSDKYVFGEARLRDKGLGTAPTIPFVDRFVRGAECTM